MVPGTPWQHTQGIFSQRVKSLDETCFLHLASQRVLRDMWVSPDNVLFICLFVCLILFCFLFLLLFCFLFVLFLFFVFFWFLFFFCFVFVLLFFLFLSLFCFVLFCLFVCLFVCFSHWADKQGKVRLWRSSLLSDLEEITSSDQGYWTVKGCVTGGKSQSQEATMWGKTSRSAFPTASEG